MQIKLEKTDRDYLYIAIILIIISVSVFIRMNQVDRFNQKIKEKEMVNVSQVKDIKVLKNSVKVLDKKTEKLMLVADSLQASENKFKLNYYALDKKLKSTIALYSKSSNDDKWNAFTKAVNE